MDSKAKCVKIFIIISLIAFFFAYYGGYVLGDWGDNKYVHYAIVFFILYVFFEMADPSSKISELVDSISNR